jgi:hypothetical protein
MLDCKTSATTCLPSAGPRQEKGAGLGWVGDLTVTG